MKTIYICGPMRGHPCFNFKRFFFRQVELEHSGYKVVNPAEMDCERWINDQWVYTDDQYDGILENDCKIIREQVDILFVLKGWEESAGSKREIEEATKKGILIVYEEIEVEKSK